MIRAADIIAKFQYALSERWGYIYGAAGGVWTQKQQDAATRDMTKKYGQKWVGCHVADCSGLFSWAFKQLGSYMYHGSDTMFRKYTTSSGELKAGKRTDGQELKPGTGVFTWKAADKKYGHVGLYIGGGLVIEAHGTIKGVIQSKASESRWTHWGELKDVDYSEIIPDPQPAPEPDPHPTLRRGSKGTEVTECQTILLRLGYSLGSCGIDGDFGRTTETAVKEFQRDHQLTADGIVGQKTWAALDKAAGQMDPVPVKNYSVTVHGLTMAAAEALAKKYPDSTIREE